MACCNWRYASRPASPLQVVDGCHSHESKLVWETHRVHFDAIATSIADRDETAASFVADRGRVGQLLCAMEVDVPPNQTLYVQNLQEKLKKEGPTATARACDVRLVAKRSADARAADLRKALYAVFSEFGRILDVVCLKTFRLRGQAWIVFEDVTSASTALKALDGFAFYGKPMRIQYAKTKSDAVAKLEGTFVARNKEERMKKREEEKEQVRREQAERALRKKEEAEMDKEEQEKKKQMEMDVVTEPHNILFVQNLPEGTTDMMLAMLFQQFPGYKEVRMVPNKPGIAFVEFEVDTQAGVAMTGLQGFKITSTHAMNVSYAKK